MSTEKRNPEEIAEVFRTFYEDPTNLTCMDCGGDAREWISVNNSVSLCGNCAALHSHLNDHISHIKSLHAADWEWKDLMLIRNGGNMKFKLFMDQFKLDNGVLGIHKYKTKAAWFYRRKLRHICEGKPEPKAPSLEEAREEVEHDNFLDKVADFFTGIFGGDKKDDIIEAHPGPLIEETKPQGLLAPRIEAEGKALEIPKKEDEPAKEIPKEQKQLPLENKMEGNYEKKDWMPSQPSQPSKIQEANMEKDLKKGEKELDKAEHKFIPEVKATFEKVRDKTENLLHESLEKLKEGIHKGADLLKGEGKHEEAPQKELPKEQPIPKIDLPENDSPLKKFNGGRAPGAPVEEKTETKEAEAEAPVEEKEPELDIFRVLRHSKTKEMIEQDQITHWKHQKDEKELQSLAGEAAEEIKARVLPTTTKSRAAQIAQQAAMVEAARGMTRLSKGEGCEHEVMLHGGIDFEYMEQLEQLAKDKKQIEKETTIEEVRKSEDFGVPEIFRANIARLASTAAEPTGMAAPQKILSLKEKAKRDARLAKKKQRAEILAQQPEHTKLTQPPIDITLPPLEKKIQEKQLEGFSIRPVNTDVLQKSYDPEGRPSPHTPKHGMFEGAEIFGKPITKASTAHLEPLTQRSVRRKHFHKQIHKKEEAAEEGADKLTEEIPKKILQRQEQKKMSLAEKFKQKVMGSFELAKDKVNEKIELVKENSIIDVAKEKFDHLKERAADKFEQVKESAIMEATMEKFEHAKDKVKDTVEWIKDKFAPAAAAGVKVAEPDEPAPQTEETAAPLKPVALNEEGEFAATKQEATADKSLESKETMRERLNV